jgi:hypothetical protein
MTAYERLWYFGRGRASPRACQQIQRAMRGLVARVTSVCGRLDRRRGLAARQPFTRRRRPPGTFLTTAQSEAGGHEVNMTAYERLWYFGRGRASPRACQQIEDCVGRMSKYQSASASTPAAMHMLRSVVLRMS